MIERTYRIAGMTCDGCAGKVTAALDAIPDVHTVAVDLDRGTATVTSRTEPAHDAVAAAVAAAGTGANLTPADPDGANLSEPQGFVPPSRSSH